MKKTALFGPDDVAALRRSHDVLRDQTEAILDVWYGFVGANPHLLASFSSPASGRPLPDYLAAVRRRFAAWILDTANADHDDAWLAKQHEIGLRHHRAKKNATDGAASTDLVPFRYLLRWPSPSPTPCARSSQRGGTRRPRSIACTPRGSRRCCCR